MLYQSTKHRAELKLLRHLLKLLVAVLFISRFCLIFTRDKFCSVANASEDFSASAKFDSRIREKHNRVSSYTSFALYPLRACLTTEQRVAKASLFVSKYHLISISVLLRD